MPDNLTHGKVCDYDFYVMNFNGGKAKLPTDTPDKFHLSLHEALDEFKRQCAANPSNYTTALGVDFTVHEENRGLNGGQPVGAMDFAHFKDGKLKILDDYEQDMVIQKEYSLKLNTLNLIKRETADLMPKIPFYDKSVDYAKENGELDKWRESMWENRRCAKGIENLIAEFHDGTHLASDSIIEGALKQFSEERVTLVLAICVVMRIVCLQYVWYQKPIHSPNDISEFIFSVGFPCCSLSFSSLIAHSSFVLAVTFLVIGNPLSS